MMRKIILSLLIIAAVNTAAIRVLNARAPFGGVGGVGVALAPRVWVWVAAEEGNWMLFCLRSTDPEASAAIDAARTGRLWRVRYEDLTCYATHGGWVLPYRGLAWRVATDSFPETHLGPNGYYTGKGSIDVPGRNLNVFHLGVPLWLTFLVLIAYPAVAFYRGPLRRYRRRRCGLCVACGYDLTGNVSGVCPECATEIRQP